MRLDWSPPRREKNVNSILVHAHDLVHRRRTFELRVDHFEAHAGEVLGLVGPNGAGKTTFLRLLAGLERPHSGTLQVFGLEPSRHVERVRTQLGWMSDDMALFDVTIGQLLNLLSGYYSTWDDALVASLMRRFDLNREAPVAGLSRGEGTRLRLITAMAYRPRVLVLDEPASGLDLGGRRALLRTVLEVVSDPSRSVIISSHLLTDVERIADRLVVMAEGRVVREGPTPDVVGTGATLEERLIEWGVHR